MKTLPIYLLVDTSDSMFGKRIQSTQEALEYALKDMRSTAQLNNVQCLIRLIQFDDNLKVNDFQFIDQFHPPKFRTGGTTDHIQALNQVLKDLEGDLKEGDWFEKPLIILITDGEHNPTGWAFDLNTNREMFIDYLQNDFGPKTQEAVKVAIAIGEDSNHSALSHFVSDGVDVLYANNSEDLVNFVRWTQNAIGGGITGLLSAPKPQASGNKDL